MSRDKVIEGLSHLQLMQLSDGEPPSASAISEQHLSGDGQADAADWEAGGWEGGDWDAADWEAAEQHYTDELDQLSLLGSLVRDVVEQDERGDSIADAVMARIEAGELPQADAGLEEALGGAKAIETERDNVVALPQRAPDKALMPQPEVPAASPANDNGGRIFALAAAAAAVAAGLFLWGRSGEQPMPSAAAPASPPAMTMTAEPRPAPETTAKVAAAEPAKQAEEDDSPVEIAAIDFGQLTGSVFYVPGEDPGASTAVVWVTDNEDEQ